MYLFDNPLIERFLDLFPSHRRLKEQVFIDPLTMLGSRRAFNIALAREFARVGRGMSEPLAIAMIDIDRFKSVNDTHGHAMGDSILTLLGTLLTLKLRATDGVFRLGGEEFAIIMPGTNLDGAFRHAEVVRKTLEKKLKVEQQGTVVVACTASIGVAVWNVEEPSDKFLARADKALYEAKNNGRNQVVRA